MISHSEIVAQSVIGRNESTALKGLYMLLIVLGHNYFFTMTTVQLQMMSYLYMFHIAAFFMLPFLYGAKRWSWSNIGDYAVRFLWPYVIIAVVFFITLTVIKHRDWLWGDFVATLVNGSSSGLHKYCGFQLLWFLPAMFAVMIIRDLYFNFKVFRILIFVVAGYIVLNTIFSAFNLKILPWLFGHLPFSLASTIPMCLYGLIVRWIIVKRVNHKLVLAVATLIALLVTVYYFNNIPKWSEMSSFMLGGILYPAAFMLIVLQISDRLAENKLLMWVGNNSLLVYLIHPFVGFALIYAMPSFMSMDLTTKIGIILLSIIIIAGVTVGVTMIITRWLKPVYNFLFPHNVRDYKALFKI